MEADRWWRVHRVEEHPERLAQLLNGQDQRSAS